MSISTKPVKTHPAKRRKRKGSSKWVKKTASLKYYNVENTAKKTTPLSYSKYTKYQHVLKPKGSLPKRMIEIMPNSEHRVTLSYLVFLMVIITGSAVTIGIVAAGGGKNLFPGLSGGPSFSISATVGQYAVYQTTMNGQTSYEKYVVTAIDTSNTNRILVTFNVYNSSSPDDFSGSPRTMQINVTNTATDVSGGGFGGAGGTRGSYSGGGNFGGGNFGGGNYGGGNYGGNQNFTPPSGGFNGVQGRGGFGGMMGSTQVLVAKESDFTSYQSQLESQSSGASSENTITVTTQTKSVHTSTTGSSGSMMMDRDMEYSPNGLLLKSTTTTSFNGNTITIETDLMGDYSNIPQ